MEIQKGNCSLGQYDYCKSNQPPEQPASSPSPQNKHADIQIDAPKWNRDVSATHQRNREFRGRFFKSSMQRPKRTVARLESNESNRKKFREDSIQFICNANKCQSTKIRFKNPLARKHGNGCISDEVMAEKLIVESTHRLPVQKPSPRKDSPCQAANSRDTKLTYSTLVSNTNQPLNTKTNQNQAEKSGSQKIPKPENTIQRNYRLESIIQVTMNELDVSIINTLNQAEKKATKVTYECLWKKFVKFCHENRKDPKEFNPKLAANFLNTMLERSPSCFLQARSALSSTSHQKHPSMGRLSDNPIIQKLSKAAKQIKPRKPKKESVV